MILHGARELCLSERGLDSFEYGIGQRHTHNLAIISSWWVDKLVGTLFCSVSITVSTPPCPLSHTFAPLEKKWCTMTTGINTCNSLLDHKTILIISTPSSQTQTLRKVAVSNQPHPLAPYSLANHALQAATFQAIHKTSTLVDPKRLANIKYAYTYTARVVVLQGCMPIVLVTP
ncbi:hypothetical protein GQ44DRAFT_418329 [Phaeosphaeriaceae sp. PMI808]|nr:hypothetical protein GQ44DRAFT_418329 [Phaeosphaeriaceae sp. PMI808]